MEIITLKRGHLTLGKKSLIVPHSWSELCTEENKSLPTFAGNSASVYLLSSP
jgi:hypothetical protein